MQEPVLVHKERLEYQALEQFSHTEHLPTLEVQIFNTCSCPWSVSYWVHKSYLTVCFLYRESIPREIGWYGHQKNSRLRDSNVKAWTYKMAKGVLGNSYLGQPANMETSLKCLWWGRRDSLGSDLGGRSSDASKFSNFDNRWVTELL